MGRIEELTNELNMIKKRETEINKELAELKSKSAQLVFTPGKYYKCVGLGKNSTYYFQWRDHYYFADNELHINDCLRIETSLISETISFISSTTIKANSPFVSFRELSDSELSELRQHFNDFKKFENRVAT